MNNDQYELWKKWQGWIGLIQFDLSRLSYSQQIHHGFFEVFEANKTHILRNQGGAFCDCVVMAYVTQVVMGIRRHVKVKKDRSVSFLKLLEDMRDNPKNLTPEFYSNMFRHSGFKLDWQYNPYSFLCGTTKEVTAELINSDINKLKEISKEIERIADKTFAHLEPDTKVEDAFIAEADNILNVFKDMCVRYICFLLCYDDADLGSWVSGDWKQVFRVPLDIRQN